MKGGHNESPLDLEDSEINSALELSKQNSTLLHDDKLFEVIMSAITNDSFANPKLIDPLYFTIMKDPVVLSSGVVMDKTTVLTPQGALRFKTCPMTR